MIEGHGDDSYKYKHPITVDFSSNIYHGLDLSGLRAHLCQCINDASSGKAGDVLSSYPEPEPYTLETELAAQLHLHPGNVCVTNGATEAIYLIAQTFAGTCSAILQPTFSEYADACRMNGHQVNSIYSFPVSPFSNKTEKREGDVLPDEVRMLWLCNPNNPTGRVYERQFLLDCILAYPHVCFVIDQSYEDFTLCPVLTAEEAAAYPNVLLLHSMTKRYAIPGLRLGYITGNKDLLNRLRTHRMPWSVNGLAIAAGLYLCGNTPKSIGLSVASSDTITTDENETIKSNVEVDTDLLKLNIDVLLQETARLHHSLQQLGGLDVWDTDTHIILLRLRYGKASALKDYLVEQHGILIRDASNFEGLDEHFFRIATQSPENNDCLVRAIGQWLSET